MSDEQKVEGAEAQAEAQDEAAIWTELQKADAGQADTGTPDHADGGKGQAEKRTPEGQAEPGTPGEDTETPSASAETPDDLWAKADPKLREAFEAEQAKRKQAEHVATIHGGRLSQAYTDLEALRAKLGERTGEATPEGQEATDREERRKQLLEEYGDSAGKLIPDIIALEEKIGRLESGLASQATAQTEEMLLQQQGVIEGQHPDWQEIVASQPFIDWANKAPGYVQMTLRENAHRIIDGASCADIVSRFKAETAPKPTPEQERHDERRKEQQEALVDPTLKGPVVTAAKGPDDPVAIWKELEAEDRRREAAGAR